MKFYIFSSALACVHVITNKTKDNNYLISVPIYTNPEVDLESQLASLDHYVPAFRLTDSKTGSNGFMLVDEKGESENLSHQLTVTAGLFDIMSSNSDVDHPLCEECTDALLDLMEQQLRLTEEELSDYSHFLRKIENDEDYENMEDLEKELENVSCAFIPIIKS